MPEIIKSEELFPALERTSLSAQVTQRLRKALMSGDLKPGQKLNGREIAIQFAVSLTPVREALLQLVAEGVLEASMGRAITVPTPTRRLFHELIQIRAEVEGLGAARAAAMISVTAIDELATIHDELIRAKAQQDYQVVLRRNEAFHLELSRAAEMPELLKVVEGLWARSGPILNGLYSGPGGWPKRPEPHFHVQVLDALKRRDGAAARHAIAQDITLGGADLVNRLPE